MTTARCYRIALFVKDDESVVTASDYGDSFGQTTVTMAYHIKRKCPVKLTVVGAQQQKGNDC